MSDRDVLLALADRAEAAEGPDRELDAEIEIAVNGFLQRAFDARNKHYPDDRLEFVDQWIGRRYTGSIDAAMGLVPEGYGLGYTFGDGPWAGPFARIWEITAESALSQANSPLAWEVHGKGATLALALVAGAIRARGVATSFSDPGMWRIEDGAQSWFFEWSDRFGALLVGPRGETRKQPGNASRFWRITAIWAKQGKRSEPKVGWELALWSEPPSAIHYYVKRGRQREIIRSDEPAGYDPHYSDEIFVECDSDGNPKGGDGTAPSRRDDSAAIAQGDAP